MMRICYIADAGSVHTQKWVNYFAQRGYEVYLISSRGNSSEFKPGVGLHLLTTIAPRLWSVSKYLNGLLWPVQARRLIRRIKPDIVDAHYITVNGYLGIASGFHPLILTAWGSDVLLDPKQNWLWKILTKYALNKTEVVICDSQVVHKELLKLGVSPGKIKMIYNGVDTQQFSRQQANEGLKRKLGILEAPSIIYIRSLKPVYNVEMLIRAIPLVLRQFPEARFIIGGDGEQKEYLQDLAKSLGISDSTRFIGWIPHNELPEYLASADVYVSTSLSDSTSLSLQEAMACELAPVVTDLPANREWITDGESGFIVPINDIQALADRITYLLNNNEVRESFGKRGREVIKERAEYEREMEKMEEIYQGLSMGEALCPE